MDTPDLTTTALLYQRVFSGRSPLLAPIFVKASVLERYRGATGYSVVRSNTIGRVKREGSWSLDFGISPQEGVIHISLTDVMNRVPEGERDHWLQHLAAPPLSENYAKTQLAPGSCIEDGDTRPW